MANYLSDALHWGVSGLLTLAALAFFFWFWVPGLRLGRELKLASGALDLIKSKGTVTDLDAVASQAMITPALAHCWNEYRDTLHPQHGINVQGVREIARWRATAMAASFFNEGTLLDIRLRTEFFKHLPGILTGLGIIGTFSGLILGLQGFEVNDDSAAVQQSLKHLLGSVGVAFIISAAAISLAMLITFIEKVMVSRRQGDVERLVGQVDSLFDSGAGEEYLQRLVESSENSATQALQIKDALVTDLKAILSEITQAQTLAFSNSHAQLGQTLTDSIKEGLHAPLERISQAVEGVTGQQGDAVNKLLTDVLVNFTQQMQDMFGGQLRGMNDVLSETARSIQTASSKFDALAAQLQGAGQDAADAMAKRVEALMESMSERQAANDAKMDEFLTTVRKSISDSQSQSAELMMGTFAELSKSTGDLVDQLQKQSDRASRETSNHVQQITAQTSEALGQQSEQVSALVQAVDQATKAIREAAERTVTGVHASVERMATGADRLHGTSVKLESSLKAMSESAAVVTGSVDKLRDASADMATSARTVTEALRDQQSVRTAILTMVTELRAVVENAKREAAMTEKLVQGIEQAAGKLNDATRTTDTYLQGVSEALVEAHQAFSTQLTSTLRQGNSTFHDELSKAVDMLRGAIQDLGDTLDGLPGPR